MSFILLIIRRWVNLHRYVPSIKNTPTDTISGDERLRIELWLSEKHNLVLWKHAAGSGERWQKADVSERGVSDTKIVRLSENRNNCFLFFFLLRIGKETNLEFLGLWGSVFLPYCTSYKWRFSLKARQQACSLALNSTLTADKKCCKPLQQCPHLPLICMTSRVSIHQAAGPSAAGKIM